jgi:hypothetical protein
MAKIVTPSQQFALQQKIARKSIREYQPKILAALQSDFDKAAQLRITEFSKLSIIRTLYLTERILIIFYELCTRQLVDILP